MATAADIATCVDPSSLPADRAAQMLEGVSGVWLLSGPAEVLAGDLATCHPRLADGEVRVRVRRLGEGEHWRLTVVAPDRPGLLATTAGVLARRGLGVSSAGVTTWPETRVALQGVTVADPRPAPTASAPDWEAVGAELRGLLAGSGAPEVAWTPAGPVRVTCTPLLEGHTLVTIRAPDRVGLLWAITSWFGSRGVDVVAASLYEQNGTADDTFLVVGSPDETELALHLAGPRRRLPWRRREAG